MSKYIDLLREHQVKSDSSTEQKEIQAIDTPINHNPYREQAVKETHSLDNMEALLEELDSSENDNDWMTENLEDTDLHPLITTEASVEQVSHEQDSHQPVVSRHSNTSSAENEHDFHISSWLRHVTQLLATMFTSAHNDEDIHLQTLEQSLSTLFEHIQTSPNMLNHLELELKQHLKDTIASTHDPDLAQKSVMMMLYSIKVGLRLELQIKELLPCTIAAMLQHLGMAMIPDSTHKATESLSDDEVKPMVLDYLSRHKIQHKQLIAAISYAGERYDGSGQQGLSGRDIPWVARLTSLLAMFEALVHFRPYRTRLFPRDAIRHIVKHHKKEFDTEIIKALIESMSLYPIGTYIQLNTGEIGQVIRIHVRFSLRPVVHINMDKHGHVINAREIDLTKQPNLMIQKCLHKEDIQDLTEGLKSYT